MGLKGGASIINVSVASLAWASSRSIRAKMPLSFQRFQRLCSVFCRPYSEAASRQCSPLRLMKMIPDNTRRSSTQGLPLSANLHGKSPAGQCMGLRKEGLKPRHLCVGQPEETAHVTTCFPKVNQKVKFRSMGPDPSFHSRSD